MKGIPWTATKIHLTILELIKAEYSNIIKGKKVQIYPDFGGQEDRSTSVITTGIAGGDNPNRAKMEVEDKEHIIRRITLWRNYRLTDRIHHQSRDKEKLNQAVSDKHCKGCRNIDRELHGVSPVTIDVHAFYTMRILGFAKCLQD